MLFPLSPLIALGDFSRDSTDCRTTSFLTDVQCSVALALRNFIQPSPYRLRTIKIEFKTRVVVSRKQTESNILTQLEVRVQLVRVGSLHQMGPENRTQAVKLGSSVFTHCPSPRSAISSVISFS